MASHVSQWKIKEQWVVVIVHERKKCLTQDAELTLHRGYWLLLGFISHVVKRAISHLLAEWRKYEKIITSYWTLWTCITHWYHLIICYVSHNNYLVWQWDRLCFSLRFIFMLKGNKDFSRWRLSWEESEFLPFHRWMD